MCSSIKKFPIIQSQLFAGVLILCLGISSGSALGQRRSAGNVARQTSDSKKALALGDFYYKNNDISDKAAIQYRRVRDSNPKSAEGATAQYFLGSYYHRKFYIQREKKLKEDFGLLVEAQGQYEDYANKYAFNSPSPEWLSDAYFNLALIFLQRGDTWKAEHFLGKMYGASTNDSRIYIYQVVWSPNSKDVVDSNLDARQLAQFTNSLIYGARNAQKQQPQQQQAPSFDYMIDRIRQWCLSHK